MNISIDRVKIRKNIRNEVTSHKIFKSRAILDKDGNPMYHEEGLFSPKIFGNFNSCTCGALTRPGFCEICNTRVINKSKLPDFYIEFSDLILLNNGADFSNYKKIEKNIRDILNYSSFVYEGKVIEYNLLELDLSLIDASKVKIGEKALKALGVDSEWIKENTYNRIYVPHPFFRPITFTKDKIFLGDINATLVNLLKKRNKLNKVISGVEPDIFLELAIKRNIVEYVEEFYTSLFSLLNTKSNSINKHEMKGHKITGAVRAVVINNFELDEDKCIIGYFFIRDLFPHLYEKYTDKEGQFIDIDGLNKELEDYTVLINRQPTIGEKSIMAFHPQFSKEYAERFVLQINPIVQDGFAGDFDGDVYLIIALYSHEAINESKVLLPSNNYLGGSNGEIRNKIFEDLEFIAQ